MNEESPEKPEANAVGSCLEVLVVWCLPSVVVPIIIAVTASAWPVGVILAILFLIWMGARSAQDSSGRPDRETKAPTNRIVLYVVAQLIMIPVVVGTVVYAVCSKALH